MNWKPGPPPDDVLTDTVVATADLVGRSGAKDLEIGENPYGWYAVARYQGARLIVDSQPDIETACFTLALRVLWGAQCVTCGRFVQLKGAPPVHGVQQEGRMVTWAEMQEAGFCEWYLDGKKWRQGCEGGED